MSEPFKLFRLQQIDTLIDQHRTRLREIDAILSDQTVIRSAEARVNETKAAFLSAREDLHHAEGLVQAQRIKIEQTEASLYGGKIRNPKELQDLQNELAALKRYLTVLEDKQLDAMMKSEEAEQHDRDAAQDLDNILQQIDLQRKELNSGKKYPSTRC